ncbi:MAG: hypothetical protein MZV63_32605 [Marinilabiliales bacterium]|nr:hypothetical protein [Marinilabiliales bacterium]
MAPLRSHIFHLLKTLEDGRKYLLLVRCEVDSGGVSMRMSSWSLRRNSRISSLTLPSQNLCLRTNGQGYMGFIHQVLLDNYLSKHEEPEEIEYYLCGPPMMNSAVLKMLDDLGIPNEAIAFDDFGRVNIVMRSDVMRSCSLLSIFLLLAGCKSHTYLSMPRSTAIRRVPPMHIVAER